MWYVASEENTMYLAHHGVRGQKWGRRRYQNEDGSLTSEGRARYGTRENFERAQRRKRIAIGAAIGAGTALAIGGGIAIARNTKQARKLRDYKQQISKWDNAELNRVSGVLSGRAKEKLAAGGKYKDVKGLKRANDAIVKELAKRARREARFNNAGKEAIKRIFAETGDKGESSGSLFGKSFAKKVAVGAGTALGSAVVGGGAAYLAGRTEGSQKTKKQKRDRYSSYMWQNPNKK